MLHVVALNVTYWQRSEPEDRQREDAGKDDKNEPAHMLTDVFEAECIAHELQDEQRSLLDPKGAVNVMHNRKAEECIQHSPSVADEDENDHPPMHYV
mmetsp:Transcript_104527/g.184404  ORF Transcript_104527/g.184404 Transcript_104527/m.184404 type:complete len:97 (+) Transcript_104527:300-590(+)